MKDKEVKEELFVVYLKDQPLEHLGVKRIYSSEGSARGAMGRYSNIIDKTQLEIVKYIPQRNIDISTLERVKSKLLLFKETNVEDYLGFILSIMEEVFPEYVDGI